MLEPQIEQAQQLPQLKEKKVQEEITIPTSTSLELHKNTASSPSTPLSRVVTTTDDSIIFTNPSSGESENTTTSHSNNIPNGQNLAIDSTETQTQLNILGNDNESDGEMENFYPASENPQQIQNNYEADEINANESSKLLPPQDQNPSVNSFHDQLNSFSFGNRPASFHETGSYIQDDDDEQVLLNTNVRRGRGSRATGVEPIDPSSIRNRNSTFTANLKNQNADSATMEIERMRNSILLKRENKKRQKTVLDDDKVLVGNKVGEGHVNYVIAYNMLTGIRVAVSRCSGIMQPITDQDFRSSKKLVFDVSGNELTPSSKYDFKFKDYCPTVFRELRMFFGLDPADYLVSLTSKYILSELNSPGKSGSFFYFSRDYRFIIKTIHPAEHRHLRS